MRIKIIRLILGQNFWRCVLQWNYFSPSIKLKGRKSFTYMSLCVYIYPVYLYLGHIYEKWIFLPQKIWALHNYSDYHTIFLFLSWKKMMVAGLLKQTFLFILKYNSIFIVQWFILRFQFIHKSMQYRHIISAYNLNMKY